MYFICAQPILTNAMTKQIKQNKISMVYIFIFEVLLQNILLWW